MNPTNAAESISSMAVFGKTALVLIALIGVIILCGWLLRRLGVGYGTGSPALKIIASRAVGPRERVVLMEIENTWLLLGVGGGKISKIHELPAPPESTPSGPSAVKENDSFANRFTRALGQNLGGHGSKR